MIIPKACDIYLGLMQPGIFYATNENECNPNSYVENCVYGVKLSDNSIGFGKVVYGELDQIAVVSFDDVCLDMPKRKITKDMRLDSMFSYVDDEEFLYENKPTQSQKSELIARLIYEGFKLDADLIKQIKPADMPKETKAQLYDHIVIEAESLDMILAHGLASTYVNYRGNFVIVYPVKQEDTVFLYVGVLINDGHGWYNLDKDSIVAYIMPNDYFARKKVEKFMLHLTVGDMVDDLCHFEQKELNGTDIVEDTVVQEMLQKFNLGLVSEELRKAEKHFYTIHDFLGKSRCKAQQLNHAGSLALCDFEPNTIYTLFTNYKDLYYCFIVHDKHLFMFPARIIASCENGHIIACREFLEFWRLEEFNFRETPNIDTVDKYLHGLHHTLKSIYDGTYKSERRGFDFKVDFAFKKDKSEDKWCKVDIWDKLQACNVLVTNTYGCFGDADFDITQLKPAFNVSYEDTQRGGIVLNVPKESLSATEELTQNESYLVLANSEVATADGLFELQGTDAFYLKYCANKSDVQDFKELASFLKANVFEVKLSSLEELTKVTALENYHIKKSLSMYDHKIDKSYVMSVISV